MIVKLAAIGLAVFIGILLLSVLGRAISGISQEPIPWEAEADPWADLEDFDSEVTHWEVWETPDGQTGYLAEISPTELSLDPGESIWVELEILAYGADSELVASDFNEVVVSHESPARVIGEFYDGDNLGVTYVEARAMTNAEPTELVPRAMIDSWTIDESSSPPVLTAQVSAPEPVELITPSVITAVVRDGDGIIIAAGSKWLEAEVTSTEVPLELRGVDKLPDGHTVEVTVDLG